MLPEPDHRSVDARLAVQAHGGTNPPNRCTPGSRTRGRSTAPASGCHDDAANAKVPDPVEGSGTFATGSVRAQALSRSRAPVSEDG